MPSELRLVLRKERPDPTLERILQKHELPSFSYFPFWELIIRVGIAGVWSPSDIKAKVDTGAAVSLLPEWLIKSVSSFPSAGFNLYGVIKSKECRVPVKLGKCDLLLSDQFGNEITLSDCWVAVTGLPDTPVLLGMKDVLERLKLEKRGEILILSD
ncbi:MAG: hypothetical protein ACFFD4_33785 [Candidatus Odinarchaeota archaeon]